MCGYMHTVQYGNDSHNNVFYMIITMLINHKEKGGNIIKGVVMGGDITGKL